MGILTSNLIRTAYSKLADLGVNTYDLGKELSGWANLLFYNFVMPKSQLFNFQVASPCDLEFQF